MKCGGLWIVENEPEVLRKSLLDCVSSSSDGHKVMIVNFWCNGLKLGSDFGHLSIAVAYHSETDRILVLDTYMTLENAWYSIEDMSYAMNTFDKDANDFRGFVIATMGQNSD